MSAGARGKALPATIAIAVVPCGAVQKLRARYRKSGVWASRVNRAPALAHTDPGGGSAVLEDNVAYVETGAIFNGEKLRGRIG